MSDSESSSSQTLQTSPPPQASSTKLDMSDFPPVYVSATHFSSEDLHQLEDDLTEAGAPLTFDVREAAIVFTKATKRIRVKFDLRSRGLFTEDVEDVASLKPVSATLSPQTRKRKRDVTAALGDDSATDVGSATDGESPASAERNKRNISASQPVAATLADIRSTGSSIVHVVKPEWFSQSQTSGMPAPINPYLIYRGRKVSKPTDETVCETKVTRTAPASTATSMKRVDRPSKVEDILERAKQDASEAPAQKTDRFGKRKFGQGNVPATPGSSWTAGSNTQYAHLLHESTTEHDDGCSSDIPEMPDWVRQHVKFACQRLSYKDTPNEAFICLLKTIRLARELTNDDIGVRAYSTSIAAIYSYPYKLTSPREIIALPGCETKIANLFVEWKNTGRIKTVEDIEADPDLKILRLFYDIWGVGPSTARDFYYEKGWRELDDVVEYGWSTLSRVQQIGVKYYDDFKDPIPRAEVEQIGGVIHQHAVKVRDNGIQSMLVGGYRRGKQACGDVDIVISHPDEAKTASIIHDLASSLEAEGWITHMLTLSLNNTKRDQQTLPFKTKSLHGGAGFDSLDKALVVWQNPNWPSKEKDLAANPKAKNPNIHRRVDIIIAPWRTVGCAVVGWSGGTTFERDLRRYATHQKKWKFDSSGVRDRANGEVVDLEGYHSWKGSVGSDGRAKTMLEAEKRVFEGFGLTYREPTERGTG